MEAGSSLGTYLAYALIGLFLLVVGLVVVRSMMLTGLLLIEPIRHAWTWLGGSGGTRRGRAAREESRSASETRGVGDDC